MTPKKRKRSTDFTDKSVLAVFRVPENIAAEAKEKARREDLSFSQLMRRYERLAPSRRMTEDFCPAPFLTKIKTRGLHRPRFRV